VSTIDLIILGILIEKTMNAFELTRFIERERIGYLLKISTPAVYKSCKRLYKAGYLEGKVTRDGEMPEKVIYTVNQKGKERFYRLMEHFSGRLNPFYFEFNSFLWNIDKLKKKEALQMLENLKNQLLRLKKWITEHEKESSAKIPFASRMIVKQYRMLVGTLAVWIKETITEYKRN